MASMDEPRRPTYEELEAENVGLRRRVARLEELLEQSVRAGKRQAAPFSKGPPKKRPKRSGRKPGKGYGAKAVRDVPEHVDETVDVSLPAGCPCCHGGLVLERIALQYQTDIPPVDPHVTLFKVQVGRCTGCGRRVQGRHPRQTSDALGAAANQIGSNALAMAAELNKAHGMAHLSHDGYAVYDLFGEAVHHQCLSHAFVRIREILAKASRGAVRFPRAVRAIFKEALLLRDRRDAGAITPEQLAVAREALETRLWREVHRDFTCLENERFARHLRDHFYEWLNFLYFPGVEATNWPAEHAMRAAVMNRKISAGNRTDRGAHAQEILVSILRTCTQQGRDAIDLFIDVLRGQPVSLKPAHGHAVALLRA